jgi:hypothetical protein
MVMKMPIPAKNAESFKETCRKLGGTITHESEEKITCKVESQITATLNMPKGETYGSFSISGFGKRIVEVTFEQRNVV